MYLVHVKHITTKIHQHGTKKTLQNYQILKVMITQINLKHTVILEEYNDLVTGVIYKNTNKKHYEDTLKNYKRDEPIAHQDLTFDEEMFNSLCDEFR